MYMGSTDYVVLSYMSIVQLHHSVRYVKDHEQFGKPADPKLLPKAGQKLQRQNADGI